MWSLDEYQSIIDINPLNLVDFFFNRKGKGSLIYYLKSRNYITKMDCGVESMKSFSLFNIEVNLTVKGEHHMEKVFIFI